MRKKRKKKKKKEEEREYDFLGHGFEKMRGLMLSNYTVVL